MQAELPSNNNAEHIRRRAHAHKLTRLSLSPARLGLIYPSPTYRKVLTRARNGVKPKKVDKEYCSAPSPQVTVKFVKRTQCVLKDSTVSYSKKPVKLCTSKANAKKSLGHCSQPSSLSVLSSSPSNIAAAATATATISSACSNNTSKAERLAAPHTTGAACGNVTSSNISKKASGVTSVSRSHAKSAASSKSMYPERRREHNDSERKRRDHLRDAFHALRDQIPKLKETQKKPARITILHEASSYVGQLIEKHNYLEKTKEAELRKREKLLKRLAMAKQQNQLE